MSNIHIADMQHMTKSWNESVDTIGDSLRQAQDFAYCVGYNRAMDKVDELKSQLRLLAEAVLEAHKGKGHCIDCPHVEYGEDYQRCKGGEYDCCKCTACKVAREVMG